MQDSLSISVQSKDTTQLPACESKGIKHQQKHME